MRCRRLVSCAPGSPSTDDPQTAAATGPARAMRLTRAPACLRSLIFLVLVKAWTLRDCPLLAQRRLCRQTACPRLVATRASATPSVVARARLKELLDASTQVLSGLNGRFSCRKRSSRVPPAADNVCNTWWGDPLICRRTSSTTFCKTNPSSR
eukprot:6485845-Amphidinium_carterae.2